LNPKYPLFLERLKGMDDLPPSARMVEISEAPLDQVLQLYAQHIAHMPPLPGMLRSFQPSQYPESVVLLIGDRVIGYVLAQVVGDVVRVPALVVLPEYRGKRIAVRLIAAMDDAVRERVSRAEFDFADSAIFTAKLASEFGHEVVRIAARFERLLT
jgi:GNAT superfamily N-acetyltransferase